MPQGGNLRRSTLLGAMNKKQVRLVVLLTDCCNSYRDTTVGKHAMSPPVNPDRPAWPCTPRCSSSRAGRSIWAAVRGPSRPPTPTRTSWPTGPLALCSRSCSSRSRGLVDVNAASQGEVALNTNDGGLFTLSLMCPSVARHAADGEEYRPDKVLGAFLAQRAKAASPGRR